MNEYEILLLLDVDQAEDRQAEIVARASWSRRAVAPGTCTTSGAGASSPTRSTTRARAATTCCSSPDAETLDEASRVLRIDDGVMRHMATRRTRGVLRGP